MRGSMPCTGSPITCTEPSLGRSRPEMRPRVVDLPQPVGPTTATNSPGATSMLISRIAVYAWPVGVKNRLVTFCNSIADVLRFDLFSVMIDESFIDGAMVTKPLSRMASWHHFVSTSASHYLRTGCAFASQMYRCHKVIGLVNHPMSL